MRPVRVLVANALYVITYQRSLELDGEQAYGIHDYNNKTIQIATDCHETIIKQTLFHELFHAVTSEYFVDLTDDESTADLVSLGFMKLFADNPKLASYLLEVK
jgi:Zn-dependent peptidase ImmA (M78 family)